MSPERSWRKMRETVTDDLGSKLSDFLRQSEPSLEEEAAASPEYELRTGEKYVFSFLPPGQGQPFRVTFEVPYAAIDQEAQHPRRDPYEEAFRREMSAFERMLPGLLRTHEGLYVAVLDENIIDDDTDELALAARLEQSHRNEFVLVRKVSSQKVQDYMESPEVELR